MKLSKKILCSALVFIMICAMVPFQVFAQGKINTAQNISYTISYKDGAKAIPNAQFNVYKVADMDEYARMSVTAQFTPYTGSVTGLNNLPDMTVETWAALANTLKGYAQLDSLAPIASGKTDANGALNLSLKTGVYLVFGYRATTDDYYTYTCTPYMVILPGVNVGQNSWNYSVTSAPKFTKAYYPEDDGDDVVSRKALKIWDDEGYESQRPEKIKVNLLKNGVSFASEELNEANDWRCSWDNLPAADEWTIVEDKVEGYSVTAEPKGITTVLTNKFIEPIKRQLPIEVTVTGDTPDDDAEFHFIMKANDPSYPMPEGSSGDFKDIMIKGKGSNRFGDIEFTKPGKYSYTIYEIDGGLEGYSYDKTVYTLTYEVIEKDGELIATPSIVDANGNQYDEIAFINAYMLPQTGMLWLPVPILLCCGIVFISCGVILRRKCR